MLHRIIDCNGHFSRKVATVVAIAENPKLNNILKRSLIHGHRRISGSVAQTAVESFAIRLVDHRSLPVPRPDLVALSRRRAIVVADDGSWTVVEPLLIVSLDYPSKKGKCGNGKSKKRRRGS